MITQPTFTAEDVPWHDRMVLRVPGKREGTVLTVEIMIYTTRICEYTEPWSYDRHWCYASLNDAALALVEYLDADAAEPAGWVKAVDRDENGHRVRRSHVIDGALVIVVDEED